MRDTEVLCVCDAQQHDRQIARNALSPKPRLPANAAQNRLRRRAHRWSGVEKMARQTLEQTRCARSDAEIVELHLRLSPGKRGRPIEGGDVPMLVGEVEHRFAGWRHHRPEGDPHDRTGGDANTAAQSKDRIKDCANCVRERPTVDDSKRSTEAPAATEKSSPVGLDLRLADRLALDGGKMRGPDFGLGWRTPAPGRQDGTDVGEIFGLHKQLGESRMSEIGTLCRQYKLRI